MTAAKDADGALAAAQDTHFHAIFLDINLGSGKSGAELLQEFRALPAYRTVPIVATTAYAMPGDEEQFLDMGFTAYIPKPFDVDRLLSFTQRLLAESGSGIAQG